MWVSPSLSGPLVLSAPHIFPASVLAEGLKCDSVSSFAVVPLNPALRSVEVVALELLERDQPDRARTIQHDDDDAPPARPGRLTSFLASLCCIFCAAAAALLGELR